MAHRSPDTHQIMEATTPFDLNPAIQNWRQQLAESPAFSGENLDELEVHLRDSVARLQGCGLSVEEAWIIATKRIGKSATLETEFSRVNQTTVWGWRALWMLLGIQVWSLVSGLLNDIARTTVTVGWRSLNYDKANGVVLPNITFGLVNLLAFAASLGICWWLITRNGENLRTRILSRLQHTRGFIAWSLVFCLLGLFVKMVGSFSVLALTRFIEPQSLGDAMVYWNGLTSFLWIGLLKGVALVVVTLLLVRRQLCVA
jgi:hypothetical protein